MKKLIEEATLYVFSCDFGRFLLLFGYMSTLLKVSKPTSSTTRTRRRLVALTLRIAEAAEDLVEEYNEYNPKFLASIEAAEQDLKHGRVKRVISLSELLPKL